MAHITSSHQLPFFVAIVGYWRFTLVTSKASGTCDMACGNTVLAPGSGQLWPGAEGAGLFFSRLTRVGVKKRVPNMKLVSWVFRNT